MAKKVSVNSFVEVNLSKLKDNTEVLARYLSPGVKQMAVVKADAYGHGAVPVARAIEDQVAWFAVNDVDEGIALREGGIDAPILVFGVPTDETAPAYPAYRLTATVSDLVHFGILRGGTQYHLNFDTGMGRLGLAEDEIPQTEKLVEERKSITCTGIYSHFATAEAPGSAMAETQLERFRTICRRFSGGWIAHMANTGGTVFYPSSHFDMVRNGIGLYGYAPGDAPVRELQPCLRWVSHLAQVRRIRKGETVSYGARWKAPEDGYIGTVPVGYEEGIPRLLTGNLDVAIAETRYPVVGTVTMNFIMVYLGPSKIYETGTPVELLGPHAQTADEWARRSQTIAYEILTGISERVPRRHVAG
ncbi:alanine racemase [Halalkalibaculum sp. DA3122]